MMRFALVTLFMSLQVGCSHAAPEQRLKSASLESALRGEPTSAPSYLGEPQIVPSRVVDAGDLLLPTGALVGSDPSYGNEDLKPFIQTVPPGRYPVRIAVAMMEHETRIGLAEVRISSNPTVRWELAITEEQKTSLEKAPLKKGQFVGYGVDAGTGSFMDASSVASVAKFPDDDDLWTRLQKARRANRINPQAPADWLNWPVSESQNLILFDSGYGDGSYPTYVGRDAQGNITAFVTDFFVFDVSPLLELPECFDYQHPDYDEEMEEACAGEGASAVTEAPARPE